MRGLNIENSNFQVSRDNSRGTHLPIPTSRESASYLYPRSPHDVVGGYPVTETRSRIRECVHSNPGLHFSDIRRRLDIATGQAQYHLRKLHRSGSVEREEVCGRTHFYPPTYSEWERATIALLRRETARELILVLLETERVTPATLSRRLDIARSTVAWHVSNLIEHDIVRKTTTSEPGDTDRVTIQLHRRAEVYRLLREIEPRPSDRLVDRFSRLADELLGD